MKLYSITQAKHNNVHVFRWTGSTDCEMHYMNAWLKRVVFNLDLNRESVSEPERYQEGYSRV